MDFGAGVSTRKTDVWIELTPSASSTRTESQSVHSFAHALTTCIENIRLRLSKSPDYSAPQTPINTSAFFFDHEEIEAALEAIASLCGRVRHTCRSNLIAHPRGLCSHSTSHRRNIPRSHRSLRCYYQVAITIYSIILKRGRRS